MNMSLPTSDKPLCIDLHCHPSMKPFGMAEKWGNENSIHSGKKNSIWNYDPPGFLDKVLNRRLGLTRFSQSNFTALSIGNVRVAFCALNPIERQFFESSLGTDSLACQIYNFITGIGKNKIRHIQKCRNNFEEFCREYQFYTQLDGIEVKTVAGKLCYKITNDYNDVKRNLEERKNISVVLTVEGAYVFDINNEEPFNENEILRKVDELKRWAHVPFFITLMHHFYNEMGGHTHSFPPFLSKYVDQKYGMNSGMTLLGKNVLRRLLEKYPRRIYIDIKHMSRQFRIEYYDFLSEQYPEDKIPIIVSHGSLNGYDSIYNCNNPVEDDNGAFSGGTCHFFDDEILMIEKSGGIFGIQLDDRHLSSRAEKKKKKWYYSKETRLFMIAGLVWNQVEHIAVLLDRNGCNAWETAAIGSDFDGIVDPPNGYWTSEDMPLLYSNLEKHAEIFLRSGRNTMLNSRNRNISAKEIMDKLFSENALRLLRDYFR